MSKIAVIGSNGSHPVVWGLGDTLDLALRDAHDNDLEEFGWDSSGWTALVVTPEIERQIEDGVVDTHRLGIHVRFDAHTGDIMDAWVM